MEELGEEKNNGGNSSSDDVVSLVTGKAGAGVVKIGVSKIK